MNALNAPRADAEPLAEPCYKCGRGARWSWFPWVGIAIVAGVLAALIAAVAPRWMPAAPAGYPVQFFWPLFPLGFLLVILLVFGLGRWALGGSWRGGSMYRDGSADPREIVRVRYARGEIDRERMRDMLRGLDEAGDPPGRSA